MAVTVYTEVQLEPIECYSCGTVFGMSPQLMKNRRSDHKEFSCPNGHSNYFPQESDEEKYKRLLKEEQGRHANTQLELMASENSNMQNMETDYTALVEASKKLGIAVYSLFNILNEDVSLDIGDVENKLRTAYNELRPLLPAEHIAADGLTDGE